MNEDFSEKARLELLAQDIICAGTYPVFNLSHAVGNKKDLFF